MLCVKISARVHHPDVSGQSGHNARIARSTVCEPNVGLDRSGTICMPTADGDEDLMGIEKFSARTSPTLYKS